MFPFTISPVDDTLRSAVQQRVDGKTKPPGALGQLEALARQIGLIQNRSDRLTLEKPTLLVFAADHGIAAEGVSAYPGGSDGLRWCSTFCGGGAAINVSSAASTTFDLRRDRRPESTTDFEAALPV